MKNLLLLTLLMGAVTYIPRMLPLVLLKDLKLPPLLDSFLNYIPYAALGALIFPGLLTSTGTPASAAAGGIVSIALALLRLNIMIVIAGGIAGVYFFNLLWS